MAVQQGRSEPKAEAYCVGYVEALNDARTTSGNGASWRAGVWAGVNSAIFTIPYGDRSHLRHDSQAGHGCREPRIQGPAILLLFLVLSRAIQGRP